MRVTNGGNIKKMRIVKNTAGGIDLVVEKDSGNEVLITTGNYKNSMAFWKKLDDLCGKAFDSLIDLS